MSDLTIVNWCLGSGGACDPCGIGGVRLDSDGNVWLPISGKYYAPFAIPAYTPITISYNGAVVWTFGPGGTMHFLTNVDTGSRVVVTADPVIPVGTYEQWECTGNILVGNLLDESLLATSLTLSGGDPWGVQNGIDYEAGAPYLGPHVSGVTTLTTSGSQFFTLPYFHVAGGLTIDPPFLFLV